MLRYMAILALIMGMANTSTLFANEIDGDSVAVRSASENLFAAGSETPRPQGGASNI